jgi:hypothetical protein
MLTAVEGVFRNGKVEFPAPPAQPDETRVIVTFLPVSSRIDLAARGIGEAEATQLRARLATFAEDWDRPEMDVYDED